MNGIQIYLKEDVPLVYGHSIYVDSPWALTSISQAQFWRHVSLSGYGDGTVRGIISVDISEWGEPGLNGKAAKDCTPEEIETEVWEQLKRSMNYGDIATLKDEQLHSFSLDPSLSRHQGTTANEEPLLVNLVDTWKLRPEAVSKIPNLFLAADYVRTYTDLATMEAANEAARRAVNGILDAAGSVATRCGVWTCTSPRSSRRGVSSISFGSCRGCRGMTHSCDSGSRSPNWWKNRYKRWSRVPRRVDSQRRTEPTRRYPIRPCCRCSTVRGSPA
jgi:uncharacterized protein with NAD-binding domain and iron-sulfur cluster